MKFGNYVNVMANLNLKSKLLAFIIGVLILAVVLQQLYIGTIIRHQNTVFVPMGLTQSVVVGNESASEEYLLAMGSYVAYLFLNFNPSTVINQYEILSQLTSGVVRTEAFKLAEEYKKTNISSRIIIDSVNVTDQDITVKGFRTKYILDRAVEDQAFALKIKYRIFYGSFRIQELSL